MGCDCCAFWAVAFLRLIEKSQQTVRNSDYQEAEDVCDRYAWNFIEKLRTNCKLDTTKVEAVLHEALGDMSEANVAHTETTFSKNPHSIIAESEFSASAQGKLGEAIANLENAIRDKARELKCQL